MIEADSTSKEAVKRIKELVGDETEIMICLDSNHTHDHVLAELNLYSELVGIGQYLIVYDTVISYMPERHNKRKRMDEDQNPMSAVEVFLAKNRNFIRDNKYDTFAIPNSSQVVC